MYERSVRERAICVRREGWSISAIHRELGVSRAAIAGWLDDPKRALEAFNRCFVCGGGEVPDAYAYLLGQYLGDGCLTTYHRVPKLRIACADDYPNIAAEVDRSLIAVSGNAVCRFQAVGCSEHATYWNHWTCLFPQHGPGRKHQRAIVLAPWQQDLVDAHPWQLLRGLIHSDGCRAMNTVRRGDKTYRYPRYFFSNESTDIISHLHGRAGQGRRAVANVPSEYGGRVTADRRHDHGRAHRPEDLTSVSSHHPRRNRHHRWRVTRAPL
jgi:hypothetical protein